MSVKDLIASAFNKDAGAFEATFNSVMDEKVGDAIAAKYDDMFPDAEVSEESVDEEVELDSEESVDEGYKKKMKEEDDADEDDDDEDDDDDDDEDDED